MWITDAYYWARDHQLEEEIEQSLYKFDGEYSDTDSGVDSDSSVSDWEADDVANVGFSGTE
jgi:hypothetical protein